MIQFSEIAIAGPSDIAGLERLVNNAYRGEEAKKGWTHEADLIEGTKRIDAAALGQLMQNEHAVILKYTLDNVIVGCVYLEKKEEMLYLGMLSVSPSIQAQGIGRKLLKAAEAYAKELSCRSIEMTVISARHELIAWYERNGYEKTQRSLPFHTEEKFGKPRVPVAFIIMKKNLSQLP
ncbi:MAG TPA: GNAT family N-acetyltransferase [Flavisolibacter sp.]|nr:GNAT family N-acetyltransferase [Flavisolibacter sp.]